MADMNSFGEHHPDINETVFLFEKNLYTGSRIGASYTARESTEIRMP
jgi:hypothetical protein